MYFLWLVPSPDKAEVPPQEPMMCMGTGSCPIHETSCEEGTALPRPFMPFCWECVLSEFEDVSEDGIQVASQTSSGELGF